MPTQAHPITDLSQHHARRRQTDKTDRQIVDRQTDTISRAHETVPELAAVSRAYARLNGTAGVPTAFSFPPAPNRSCSNPSEHNECGHVRPRFSCSGLYTVHGMATRHTRTRTHSLAVVFCFWTRESQYFPPLPPLG